MCIGSFLVLKALVRENKLFFKRIKIQGFLLKTCTNFKKSGRNLKLQLPRFHAGQIKVLEFDHTHFISL